MFLRLVKISFILGIAALLLSVVLPLLRSSNPPRISIDQPSGDLSVDDEAKEMAKWLAAGYQLDVYVTSAHASKHASSTDALRCMNNRGNVAAFSEFGTRRVHLLCWDDAKQTLYDVIVNRINFLVEKFKNPRTDLITAYALSA